MMRPRPLRLFGLIALATAATALLGGCIPVEHVDASPVSGRVVDRATSRPVAGAQVTLSAIPNLEAHTQTNQDGRFHLAGFQHWELIPLPYGAYRPPTAALQVSAAGYRLYDKSEFYPDADGSLGYSSQTDKHELRIALIRAGKRPVSTQGN